MLQSFFRENVESKQETKEVFVSDRYKENGEPIKWVIKRLTAREESTIRSRCMVRHGNKMELDTEKYLRELVVSSVKFPNLHDKELQDSYGVMGARELIEEMLYFDEYLKLQVEVNSFATGNIGLEDKIEEAKN